MVGINAISSWSGGKDSCLAYYKAVKQGYRIKALLNFISKEYRRCCFHGVEADLIKLQAELMGVPLVQKEVTSDMAEYEKEFKSAVSEFKNMGAMVTHQLQSDLILSAPQDFSQREKSKFDVPTRRDEHADNIKSGHNSSKYGTITEALQAMVFGDIYLDEHKEWVDRVCSDIGITPVEPLWNNPPLDIVKEFINLGFKAIVVSCQADKVDKDFVGRYVDESLIKELELKNICPCGENGEFHTLVVDGPIFKRGIEILDSELVLKESFWKYWFLDIKRYR